MGSRVQVRDIDEDGVGQELLDRHRLPTRLPLEGRLYLRLDR